MDKNLSLEVKKIADKNIINAIGEFTNVDEETIKMITSLCKENKLYSRIFVKLADEIRLGIDSQTIKRIAENMKEDILKTKAKQDGIVEEFAQYKNKAA